MILLLRFLALPASLLLLVANATRPASSRELDWPYNLPPHVKYFPEDEATVRRDISLAHKLEQQSAVGVRKMSPNPDEKFFLHYWSLESANDHNFDSWTNISSMHELEPCSPLHSEEEYPKFRARRLHSSQLGRSTFDKRAFQCPAGTNACTSIGEPNSCCATGTTCQLITDTGLGDVGCCPDGETCAGSLSSCPTSYTACPNNPGGGCCIPGYACLDVGCIYTGTATVYVTQSVATSTIPLDSTTTLTLTTVVTPTSPSVEPPVTITSTSIVVPPPPASSPSTSTTITTTTEDVVPPPNDSTRSTTSTIVPNILTCSSGFKSCASSLGGGCCPTDRGCARDSCPALTTTNVVIPPARPTTAVITTTTAQTTISGAGCPTGFYACSAYYQGGCCQVGRDCAKTNCPTSASTSLITGNGITIVAPTGSGISTEILSGTCASGWFSCSSTYGGGCCPLGYACGTSCTATASGGGGSQVGKEAPESFSTRVADGNSGWRMAMVLLGAICIFVL